VLRKKYLFREFHVEGFVNQYVLQGDPQERRKEFISEAIENIGPEWSASTIYEILDEDEFHETFELAGHGKPWACFLTNEFKRVIDE
tara:strand:- start:1629 stop:1889 length:261 start_codon:yes stop_codon:yes gene_type:complete